MAITLPQTAPTALPQTESEIAVPPRPLLISLAPVTVDPADEHACAWCHQPLSGPWGHLIAIEGDDAELVCPDGCGGLMAAETRRAR